MTQHQSSINETPIIEVSKLTKRFQVLQRPPGLWGTIRSLFNAHYKEVTAVDELGFSIQPGELVGYLGPNGAGKSTTIKMLTGILHPTSGHIRVASIVPSAERERYSRLIGVVFGQRSQLLWDLPPRDTFELLAKLYTIPPARFNANLTQFTELLDLADILDRPVRLLSLGQRMRCELVAALLHDPPLLYLDEPTIGLDVVAKERIHSFILQLNQMRGTTVLLTTHDLADIEALCTRLIIIDSGRVIYDGTLTKLRERYGRRRRMVFTFAEPMAETAVVQALERWETEVQVQEGKVVVSFDPQQVTALEITRQIVNSYPVVDLTVEAVALEDIIKEIYTYSH